MRSVEHLSRVPAPARPAPSMTRRPSVARCDGAHGRGWRLTRRGQLVVVALVTVVLSLLVPLRASAMDEPAAGWQVHVVQPGDTLWSLARQAEPVGDPRPLMTELRAVNDLASAELQAGQTLLVPPPLR